MIFEAMLFDLDDTLYPSTSGMWQVVGDRMERFMIDVLKIKKGEVAELREHFLREYGTTLRGLRSLYQFEALEFLNYVHDIPLELYISPNEVLAETLQHMDERKIIFTNANRSHAERVLTYLGVSASFDQIIDIIQIEPYCKPFPDAYIKAIQLAGIKNPKNCVVIDDSARNLETASRLGFFTIQVGTCERAPYVDAAIASINDLTDVIPVEISEKEAY